MMRPSMKRRIQRLVRRELRRLSNDINMPETHLQPEPARFHQLAPPPIGCSWHVCAPLRVLVSLYTIVHALVGIRLHAYAWCTCLYVCGREGVCTFSVCSRGYDWVRLCLLLCVRSWMCAPLEYVLLIICSWLCAYSSTRSINNAQHRTWKA